MDKAAALMTMRLVDDTGRLIRAPEVRFSADEIGLDAFGYNIENRILMAALEERAAELAGLTRLDDEAEPSCPTRMASSIRTAIGGSTLSARLVVGADGRTFALPRGRRHRRHAPRPRSGGIDLQCRPFPAAPEYLDRIHTPHGPCVFVPLPGDRCSVVWVPSPRKPTG